MKPRADWGLFDYRTADGKRWGVRLRTRGRLWQRQGFFTKTDARNFRDKIRSERFEGTFFPDKYRRRRPLLTSLDDLLVGPPKPPDWATLTERLKRRWWDRDRYARFWATALKGTALEDLDARMIDGALAMLRRGPSTRNHYLKWLRTALKDQAVNPARTVGLVRPPKAPEFQYSVRQETALYRQLGTEAADLVRLTLLTAMRRQELFGLQKAWIHWQAAFILLPDPKAGEPQYVHLTPEAVRILRRIVARSPAASPWVVPSPKNPARHLTAGTWYTKVFKPARDRAKIPSTHTFHTLRHTFPGRLAATGVPDVTIQELGRWKTPGLVTRYTHHFRPQLQAALVKAFPDVSRSMSGKRRPAYRRASR